MLIEYTFLFFLLPSSPLLSPPRPSSPLPSSFLLSSPLPSSFLLSSPLLSSPLLSSPLLSSPLLSSPLLSCPVLSCPVLSCPLLSSPLLSSPPLSSPLLSSLFFSSLLFSSFLYKCKNGGGRVVPQPPWRTGILPNSLFHILYWSLLLALIKSASGRKSCASHAAPSAVDRFPPRQAFTNLPKLTLLIRLARLNLLFHIFFMCYSIFPYHTFKYIYL